jgi:hypothetical protein
VRRRSFPFNERDKRVHGSCSAALAHHRLLYTYAQLPSPPPPSKNGEELVGEPSETDWTATPSLASYSS